MFFQTGKPHFLRGEYHMIPHVLPHFFRREYHKNHTFLVRARERKPMYRNIHFGSLLRRIAALSVLCGFCGSTGDNSMWYSMWFVCGFVWFLILFPIFRSFYSSVRTFQPCKRTTMFWTIVMFRNYDNYLTHAPPLYHFAVYSVPHCLFKKSPRYFVLTAVPPE